MFETVVVQWWAPATFSDCLKIGLIMSKRGFPGSVNNCNYIHFLHSKLQSRSMWDSSWSNHFVLLSCGPANRMYHEVLALYPLFCIISRCFQCIVDILHNRRTHIVWYGAVLSWCFLWLGMRLVSWWTSELHSWSSFHFYYWWMLQGMSPQYNLQWTICWMAK